MSVTRARQVPEEKKIWNFAEKTDQIQQRILGFSGKIGSGKTSHCNFIFALAFTHLLQRTPFAEVNKEGKLVVQDKDNKLMIVDPADRSPAAIRWNLQEGIFPFIRLYSTAEYLKKISIELFDLDYSNVYGSQEDKNKPTHLLWENMPSRPYVDNDPKDIYGVHSKIGTMTGREFLEYLGTDIIRKIHPDAHANALARLIKTEDPYYGLSYICLTDDIRFPNEVKALQDIGGKVIRLTRETDEAKKNLHESNCSLDNQEHLFDHVIDNQNLTMEESFGKLMSYLYEIGWFSQVN